MVQLLWQSRWRRPVLKVVLDILRRLVLGIVLVLGWEVPGRRVRCVWVELMVRCGELSSWERVRRTWNAVLAVHSLVVAVLRWQMVVVRLRVWALVHLTLRWWRAPAVAAAVWVVPIKSADVGGQAPRPANLLQLAGLEDGRGRSREILLD